MFFYGDGMIYRVYDFVEWAINFVYSYLSDMK